MAARSGVHQQDVASRCRTLWISRCARPDRRGIRPEAAWGRLEDRPARVGFLYAACGCAGARSRLSALAWARRSAVDAPAGMAIYVFLHRAPRRDLFSRLDAESARAQIRAHGFPAGHGCPLWAFAFQQARGLLQLALCATRSHCRSFLWARVADGAADRRLNDYPCKSRYAVGRIIPLKLSPDGRALVVMQ